jgi:phage protein D
MFKYISVKFPETSLGIKTLYSARLIQHVYEHEILVAEFKDWGLEYDVVTPGTAVSIKLTDGERTRNFYGYVHHVKLKRTPANNFSEVTFVGGSFPMKQRRQEIYKDKTADQIIKSIASDYEFVCYAIPHPRIYPQVSQAGVSDWSFMVKLAKQCGYSLRTENTELYFQPMLEDYKELREEAPYFVMRSPSSPEGSTLYSFEPIISESMPYDGAWKSAVAVSGVDANSAQPVSITQQLRNKTTRGKKQFEFFDSFDVETVALSSEVAAYEAEAAENRNSFPYRARAEVLGSIELRPDMPIHVTGVDAPYNGYWVILSTEHVMVEEARNVFKYTTILELGSDSLGIAQTWTDSKTITAPNKKPKRVVKANVKQTKVRPSTALNVKRKRVVDTNKGSFGTINNRSKPSAINGRSTAANTWKSKTRSLNTVIAAKKKGVSVTNRLAKKRGLVQ